MSLHSALNHYWEDGYAIVRSFLPAEEVTELGAAADQIYQEGVRHGRPFRHGNLFYNVRPGDPPLPFLAQWPAYHQARLNAFRLDPRLVHLLEPLIGRDLKQIINQLHWKDVGAPGDFAWHQDSRFREPASAYRNLASSYVQTGLAIDPHRPESGCMRFIRGSHLRGDLQLDSKADVLGRKMSDGSLASVGLSPDDSVDVTLEPGDLALWSPYLVHGSGANSSDHRRRIYINGYVRAGDCDRGEWAFRDGQPVPLGPEPALVHYEALHERGEPHYL